MSRPCRAARAARDLTREDIAQKTGVPKNQKNQILESRPGANGRVFLRACRREFGPGLALRVCGLPTPAARGLPALVGYAPRPIERRGEGLLAGRVAVLVMSG
jgi:transcriptional regulator with XRE-family HTH domain